jgi:hypothetical protein
MWLKKILSSFCWFFLHFPTTLNSLCNFDCIILKTVVMMMMMIMHWCTFVGRKSAIIRALTWIPLTDFSSWWYQVSRMNVKNCSWQKKSFLNAAKIQNEKFPYHDHKSVFQFHNWAQALFVCRLQNIFTTEQTTKLWLWTFIFQLQFTNRALIQLQWISLGKSKCWDRTEKMIRREHSNNEMLE